MIKEIEFNAKGLVKGVKNFAKELTSGVLLVSVQGLNKGQTVSLINRERQDLFSLVKPHGYKELYLIPSRYIMLPGEDIEYPRCQEIDELWNYSNN
jgi:hypothetical protein